MFKIGNIKGENKPDAVIEFWRSSNKSEIYQHINKVKVHLDIKYPFKVCASIFELWKIAETTFYTARDKKNFVKTQNFSMKI